MWLITGIIRYPDGWAAGYGSTKLGFEKKSTSTPDRSMQSSRSALAPTMLPQSLATNPVQASLTPFGILEFPGPTAAYVWCNEILHHAGCVTLDPGRMFHDIRVQAVKSS